MMRAWEDRGKKKKGLKGLVPSWFELEKKGEKEEDGLLKKQGRGYAASSTIHGLTYIAEEGRPYTEKYAFLFNPFEKRIWFRMLTPYSSLYCYKTDTS